MSGLKPRILASLGEIPAAAWDRVAGDANPFVSHAFLKALEESGSATPETGWLAQHILIEDEAGQVTGAMPLYLKGHSQGEYVFDHAWADAFTRAGGRYYPKLLCAVPFTPVTGPRLMTVGPNREAVRRALLQAAIGRAEELGVSSLHLNFLSEDDWQFATGEGLLPRIDQQFHWENQDYSDFEDFLDSLSSRKRKAIRKERREAVADGIEIEHLTGRDITEAHWDAYFAFYMDTGSRKWGRPYLNRTFFSMLGETLGDRCLLVMCRRNGRYIAGALNLIGADTLYGRYWGCIEDHRFLHFEVCYYQAIDYAIAHGLKRVEAGAQGEHKLARGYLPTPTFSAHWIADAGFRRAVARYLEQERAAALREIEVLEDYSPFRRGGEQDS